MRESGIEQNMGLPENRVPQNPGIVIIFPIQILVWGVYPIFRRTHMQKNEPGRRKRARIQKLAFF